MRLFVAVWPPQEVIEALSALARPDTASLRWTTPAQWHVTLRFMGSVDDDEVPAVVAALEAAAAAPAPLARLGEATGRFRHSVLHVPVSGLEEVARAVRAATERFGQPPEDRAFHGHLTLARARDRRGSPEIARLAGQPVEARSWTVGEVALVRSVPGRGGARYTDVSKVPLTGSY